MMSRFQNLLILIVASTFALILGYCVILYSEAIKADIIQDRRVSVLVRGEIAHHAGTVRQLMEVRAVSDSLFNAAQRGDIEAAKVLICLPETTSNPLFSMGLMTQSGDALMLCEGGAIKSPQEHQYVFDPPRRLSLGEFDRVLEEQTEYRSVIPEFLFRERYLVVAERPYLLVSALLAPQQRRSLSEEYRPTIVFAYANMRGMLRDLQAKLGISGLRMADRADVTGWPNSSMIGGGNDEPGLALAWNPSRAFRSQLLQVLPGVVALSVLVLLALAYLLGRIGRLQASLVLRESEMRRVALHDGLTGLPNRIFFHKLFDELVADHARLSPMYAGIFDLDHFKAVNDTYGHNVGDRLIIEVGNRAKASLGNDNIVARLGGDEFAFIIKTALSDEHVMSILDMMGRAIGEDLVHGETVFKPSASIGVARIDAPDTTIDHLLKIADIALYEVKANGRGHCRIFSERRMRHRQPEGKRDPPRRDRVTA